jgi:hypothetical protein
MSMDELKDKWRDLYGSEPPNVQKSFLQKRLAYRIQELFYGGISSKAKQKLSEVAGNDPLCSLGQKNTAMQNTLKRTGNVSPGTRFVREWNGTRYEVTARPDGFEYKGKIYRSLTAVATDITGTKWSGNLFFGLKRKNS